MAPGRVGPGNIKAIGQFNIIITNGYTIFAQGSFYNRHRAAHTQARIGINIITADKTLYQLINHIILFGKALPRSIKGYRIGPVFINKSFKNSGGAVKRFVPAYRCMGIFLL
jgi:hypothetical protein